MRGGDLGVGSSGEQKYGRGLWAWEEPGRRGVLNTRWAWVVFQADGSTSPPKSEVEDGKAERPQVRRQRSQDREVVRDGERAGGWSRLGKGSNLYCRDPCKEPVLCLPPPKVRAMKRDRHTQIWGSANMESHVAAQHVPQVPLESPAPPPRVPQPHAGSTRIPSLQLQPCLFHGIVAASAWRGR